MLKTGAKEESEGIPIDDYFKPVRSMQNKLNDKNNGIINSETKDVNAKDTLELALTQADSLIEAFEQDGAIIDAKARAQVKSFINWFEGALEPHMNPNTFDQNSAETYDVEDPTGKKSLEGSVAHMITRLKKLL